MDDTETPGSGKILPFPSDRVKPSDPDRRQAAKILSLHIGNKLGLVSDQGLNDEIKKMMETKHTYTGQPRENPDMAHLAKAQDYRDRMVKRTQELQDMGMFQYPIGSKVLHPTNGHRYDVIGHHVDVDSPEPWPAMYGMSSADPYDPMNPHKMHEFVGADIAHNTWKPFQGPQPV